ncbi:hypothetical protein BCM02_105232 [Paenibacillus methanolicus]|uniref:Uncharacterized protein n=2 Tax=Paenibacillus methanolicus TaxID=582686 RepID=A0A5S5C7V6_9BACL|nr:hypothetical protein BCM02_105232 [Paenibacillus methanolicus]
MTFTFEEVMLLGIFVLALLTYLNGKAKRLAPSISGDGEFRSGEADWFAFTIRGL